MASLASWDPTAWVLAVVAPCAMAGCQPLELDVAVDVLLPADESALTRTDNVSLVIEPLGTTQTIATDGLDFSLSLSLPPQAEPQTLSLFLAEGDTLLAWGKTPAVPLSGASAGASLLVSQPDVLSRFAAEFDAPDPMALAAAIGDIGMLVLASDGTAVFLDVFAWQVRGAAAIPSDNVIAPDNGVLVPDPDGGAQRIAIADGLVVLRFDPIEDTWASREADNEAQARFGARPNAPTLVADGGASLWVVGGEQQVDVVSVSLSDDSTVTVAAAAVPDLDAPRPGATTIRAQRGEGERSSSVLFGAQDDRPVAWLIERGLAVGPPGPWTGAACAILDEPDPNTALRVICLGGIRDGAATGDAVVLELPPPSATELQPTATVLADLLDGPMADPVALRGGSAVYAQGAARAVNIDLVTPTVQQSAQSPDRARGGHLAALPLGITFLVGGVTGDDAPVSRWTTFIRPPG